jgi:transcriptional regulator with XRE-family HTH domain
MGAMTKMATLEKKPQKRGATLVDAYVGSRIRDRREDLNLSQSELGQKADLSFQQVQKYERGANRISASRMHQFAGILGVGITYFFDGLEEGVGAVEPIPGSDVDTRESGLHILAANPGADRLLRAYAALPAGPQRKKAIELLEVLGNLS